MPKSRRIGLPIFDDVAAARRDGEGVDNALRILTGAMFFIDFYSVAASSKTTIWSRPAFFAA